MGSGAGSSFRDERIPGPYWRRRSINYEQTFAGSRALTKENKGALCLLDRHIVPMRRRLCAMAFHRLPLQTLGRHIVPMRRMLCAMAFHRLSLPTLASFLPVFFSAPASWQLPAISVQNSFPFYTVYNISERWLGFCCKTACLRFFPLSPMRNPISVEGEKSKHVCVP